MPLRGKLALALASAGLTLALAEGVAWLVLTRLVLARLVLARLVLARLVLARAPLHLTWDQYSAPPRAQSLRDELYRPGPHCFFRLKPDLDLSQTASGMIFDVRTNSLGLRGEEFLDPRPVGGVRVL